MAHEAPRSVSLRRLIGFQSESRSVRSSAGAAGESQGSRPRGTACARGREGAVPRELGGADAGGATRETALRSLARSLCGGWREPKGKRKGPWSRPRSPSARPPLKASRRTRRPRGPARLLGAAHTQQRLTDFNAGRRGGRPDGSAMRAASSSLPPPASQREVAPAAQTVAYTPTPTCAPVRDA